MMMKRHLAFKLYISYFAQIRNFPPSLIPISTAMWQPKWYKPELDKRGVVLGLSIPDLSPAKLESQECIGCDKSFQGDCSFTRNYRKYLDTLDINKIMSTFDYILSIVDKNTGIKHDICLIVYETPWNKCSERKSLVEWFNSHGYELPEWNF